MSLPQHVRMIIIIKTKGIIAMPFYQHETFPISFLQLVWHVSEIVCLMFEWLNMMLMNFHVEYIDEMSFHVWNARAIMVIQHKQYRVKMTFSIGNGSERVETEKNRLNGISCLWCKRIDVSPWIHGCFNEHTRLDYTDWTLDKLHHHNVHNVNFIRRIIIMCILDSFFVFIYSIWYT